MKTNREIREWMKATAQKMYDKDLSGMSYLELGEGSHVVLAVGWMSGYDPADADGEYRSKRSPEFALNAALVKYNPDEFCDLEFAEQPYYEDTGDVYDTMSTLASGLDESDWKCLAHCYMKDYRRIMSGLNDGTLV